MTHLTLLIDYRSHEGFYWSAYVYARFADLRQATFDIFLLITSPSTLLSGFTLLIGTLQKVPNLYNQ